ncbi:hypothetical protein [Mycoplasmopsis felis]|uniref:hypothetical protein n=2 Tax=Mycoplasmopsis felis TaxID=33923 RepID=UPI002AFE3D51|nr:hypothetical protein [Mycoplasmopsis felis]WQQ09973.1 hypothetical protein RRG49_03255 [Mycoplasmopsis felis]
MENLKQLKTMYGRFFTITNPFKNNYFFKWYKSIEKYYHKPVSEMTFLEPFAGENNIIDLIQELNLSQPLNWDCFDINQPKENKVPEFDIKIQDTIKEFPKGYKVAITNPPYLAKNKAKKINIENFDNNYSDLYLNALDKMLNNCDFVACIIPESFITSGQYHERLYCVISLEMKMFSDTETPVCLALFNKEKTNDFFIVRNGIDIGYYSELKKYFSEYKTNIDWQFNDPDGLIGLYAVDNTKEASIKFLPGNQIDKNSISHSSRSITRISFTGFKLSDNELLEFIKLSNDLLNDYRKKLMMFFSLHLKV